MVAKLEIKFMQHFIGKYFVPFLFSLNLFSQLQDHFKKIEGKSDIHTMSNIDFIYMINLDKRPEKWEKSYSQLASYGIYPFRFSAINGWELSIDAINDIGLKYETGMSGGYLGTSYHFENNLEPSHEIIKKPGQTYFCHCMARGTIGIILSHLSILQDAYDSGYKTIWVMEDDIEIIKNPNIISDLIDKLDKLAGKNKWDVLFTDRNTRDANGKPVPCRQAANRPNFNPKRHNNYAKKKILQDFICIGARFGAYSVIYRRSGIRKILNFIKNHSVFHPYDMDFYLPLGIKLFTVRKNIVSNLIDAISDNGAPSYLDEE